MDWQRLGAAATDRGDQGLMTRPTTTIIISIILIIMDQEEKLTVSEQHLSFPLPDTPSRR